MYKKFSNIACAGLDLNLLTFCRGFLVLATSCSSVCTSPYLTEVCYYLLFCAPIHYSFVSITSGGLLAKDTNVVQKPLGIMGKSCTSLFAVEGKGPDLIHFICSRIACIMLTHT